MKPLHFAGFFALSASAIGSRQSRQHRLDLGSICLSPFFGSDVKHTSLCSGDGMLPRYQPSKAHKDANGWTRVGPCYRNGTGSSAEEYCIYFNAEFANGRGVSILTDSSRAAHIASSKAFKPESWGRRNKMSHKTKVVPVAGKEYGVVATETIFRGEVVMSETASLMIDYGSLDIIPFIDILRMQSVGLDYLPFDHRNRVLNMSTHGTKMDHIHKIEKIAVTNAFDVEMNDEREDSLYAIFADTARMNHDCRPNIDYWFDPKTLTQHATAVRNIYPGEELTLSYINPLRTREERLNRLKSQWGFDCSCAACQASDRVSEAADHRIEQLKDLRKEFNDWTPSSRATPELAELMISLYEQERIYTMLGEAYTHAAIEYNGAGNPWMATKYANLAIETYLAVMQEEDGDIVEMEKLVEDPWSHWSWMVRTKKRMNWSVREPEEEE